MDKIRIFEAFAGYGSQSMAMQRLKEDFGLDYEIVGISEIDKYAIQAYNAVHPGVHNYGASARLIGTKSPISTCSPILSPAPTSAVPDSKRDWRKAVVHVPPSCGNVRKLSRLSDPSSVSWRT